MRDENRRLPAIHSSASVTYAIQLRGQDTLFLVVEALVRQYGMQRAKGIGTHYGRY